MDKLKAQLLDTKTLTVAGTSVALLFALYVIFKLMTNDFVHLEAQIVGHNESTLQIQQETNKVLRDVATALEGNTRVLQSLTK